eukprot:985037_1
MILYARNDFLNEYDPLILVNKLSVQSVDFCHKYDSQQPIRMIHVYSRPDSSDKPQIESDIQKAILTNQINHHPNNTVLLGDLNARHEYNGDTTTETQGRMLLDFLKKKKKKFGRASWR